MYTRRKGIFTYVDDVTSLSEGRLGIEGESGVDFGRDLAWHNLEDLTSELDEEVIERGIHLIVDVLALPIISGFLFVWVSLSYVLLAVLNSIVNQLRVFGLLGCGQDEGGVGGGILRLVFLDCYRRSAVAAVMS